MREKAELDQNRQRAEDEKARQAIQVARALAGHRSGSEAARRMRSVRPDYHYRTTAVTHLVLAHPSYSRVQGTVDTVPPHHD